MRGVERRPGAAQARRPRCLPRADGPTPLRTISNPPIATYSMTIDGIDVEGATLPMLLGSAVDAAQGIQPRALSRWRGREIHVASDPVQRVLADGEDAGRTPVDVTVAAGAIRILVPNATRAAAPVLS